MKELLTSACTTLAEKIRFRTIEGFEGVPIVMGEVGPADAPPVILIHGLAQSGLCWLPLLLVGPPEALRLIIYDLRGHGASGKPWRPEDYRTPEAHTGDLSAVASAAGIERFCAVAWSFGAYVLMDYVRKFGTDTLSGINLVGSLAGLVQRPSTGALNPEQMKAAQQRSVSDNPMEVMLASLGQAEFVTHGHVNPDVQGLVEVLANQLPAYARRAIAKAGISDNRDLVESIRCPLLLSAGTEDFTVPNKSAEELVSKIPSAQLSLYDGCGHAPFLETPARFSAELTAFALRTAA